MVSYSRSYIIDDFFFTYKTGVLNRCTATMDLVKIKDINMKRSLFERLFGIARLEIYSKDKSHPYIVLKGIPKRTAFAMFEKINIFATDTYVEYRRRRDAIGRS